MQEAVAKYLTQANAAARAREVERREKVLLDAGLYQKEYAPDGQYTQQYSDRDPETGKFYRKVPLAVNEEEWEAIQGAYQKERGAKGKQMDVNAISRLFIASAAIIFIAGFIIGIVLGNASGVEDYYNGRSFNFGVALACWIVADFAGTAMLGFGEIIQLLHNIQNNTVK